MAREEYDEREDEKPGGTRELSKKARRLQQRGWWGRLSDRLIGGQERPGEQKVGRSPIVLILAGSTVGALVLSLIFWFMISSTREERALKEAALSLTQERYADAETQFMNFMTAYPESRSAPTAMIGLHRSRVEKNIMPDTPHVVTGLEELNTLIKDCRELPGFADLKDDIRRYADRLTFAGARMAEIAQDQSSLDVSREAMQILIRYAGDEGLKPERQKYLEERQRLGEAAVAKKSDFDVTLNQIAQQMEVGDTIGAIQTRAALIDKYKSLESDKAVGKILDDILTREMAFVVRSDIGKDALGPIPDVPATPSLALTLRTRAATDVVSQGRAVFSIGIDSCFAVDADTGDPLWRKPIGVDSPFAPITVKGSEPTLLVYSTLTEELQMLSQKDGSLQWRQSCESRPTAAPLVMTDTMYLTTKANELWQISVASGRAIAKLRFSQPVIGPPTVSSDAQRLVIPGDQTLVYTIGINQFGCIAVSQIPHRAGSVKVPMLSAGRYFLLCDNATADTARVQTLQMNDEGQLSIVAADSVDGQVYDPCLLRGYELFVPSTPQRITAFRVADEANQPPLSRVGVNQLEEGIQTRMFLLAGPGGQLWLGGRDLRKFQTRTNTILLDSGVTAEGIHLQPIQFADEAVFLTSRTAQSTSVFFTRADREQMKGTWRTVLGSRLVAVAPASGGQSLLAIADYGEAYRVPLTDVANGGFSLESISRFRLPDKLTSSVEGLVLKDGRPAAWCGASEPSLWTFTTTGQLERKWPLPDVPEVPPVAIDGGVVFAMPGRLHISAVAGAATPADFQSTKTQDQQQPWKSLTALSNTQVLAISGENEFIRVEFRATPKPQLAEVSVTKMTQIVEVPPTAANGFLLVATAEGKLLLMQASTLEILAEASLGGVPSASPKVTGEHVFVEVAHQEVKVFHLDNTLPQTGSISLQGFTLSGAPLALPEGGFLAGRSDGLLIRLDANGTATEVTRNLGQGLQHGPALIHGQILVVGLDGSLYIIDPRLSE